MERLPLTRVRNLSLARQRYGARVEGLLSGLMRTDPWAERAVKHGAVKDDFAALLEQAARPPLWLDQTALQSGGELIHRTGIFSIVALASAALVQSYASPAGNKPLIMSGRLEQQAYRRLHETAQFLLAVCAPRSMLPPDGEGFQTCLRIRLIHARVRHMIWNSGKWQPELWGEPANQHDLLGTLLAFTILLLEALERLGIHVPEAEAESYIQLFRYAGFVLGVEEGLLPVGLEDLREIAAIYRDTENPPDDDSRALAAALFESPVREARSKGELALGYLLRHLLIAGSRELLPENLIFDLKVPPTPMQPLLRMMRPVAGWIGNMGLVPVLRSGMVWTGRTFWEQFVQFGLGGQQYGFPLPDKLGGRTPH